MKKIYLLLSLLIICVSSLFAQAPEKFTYQAVVRNASNQLVINAQVGVRVNILQGTATGNAVYSESHVTSSNANGLVTVNIGGGSVLHGSFEGIDWSDGPYFLKTDIDPNGGNDYTITSTQQLLSVPYALYAKEAANGFSGDYNDLTNTPQIPTVPTNVSAFTNDAGYITAGQVPAQVNADWDATSGAAEILNKPTIPTVPTNVSAFTNDAGYITGYTETDPQFTAWDKDYNDLINKPAIPTVPTNVSAFTNDAGYITSAAIPTIPTVPTNVSAFTNDAGYITAAQVPAQVNADWNATSGAAQILNKPALFSGNYNDLTNKPVLFSGNYNDLTNKPTLFDGNYNSLTNRPNLAAVAISGSYNDLINKPAIPTAVGELTNNVGYITQAQVPAQVNADWNATSGAAQILNKPTIPTVPTNVSAFTNDAGYITSSDLPGTPTLPTNVSAFNNDAGYITLSQIPAQMNADWNATTGVAQILNKPTLFSGNYNDLTNKPFIPTVPTNVSAFNNDAGYITLSQIPAQMNADWNATTGAALILNKPTLFSGNYNDLTNKPTLFSGSYNDLTDKPTIPAAANNATLTIQRNESLVGTFTADAYTNTTINIVVPTTTGDLTNNSGFITAADIPEIPTNVSQLNNDAGYLTTAQCGDVNICDLADLVAQLQQQVAALQQQIDSLQGQSGQDTTTIPVDTTTIPVDTTTTPVDTTTNPIDTTTIQLPTVTTSTASNITSDSATVGGNVTSDGGATVTSRGLCWSTNHSPTIAGSHISDGIGTGSFTSSITGLLANTTYYVRAYATNSVGTAYGNEVSFTTIGGGTLQDGLPCSGTPTVTDHEGNVYNTVQIGDQCWMRENLRTTTSPSTGTYLIPTVNTSRTYTGKQARWYNNDSTTYAPQGYGLLYNWNAAVDTFNMSYGETSVNDGSYNAVPVSFSGYRRGICPLGWHLPNNTEWKALTNYVSSQSEYVCERSSYIAKALAATTGWNNNSNECAVGNDLSANNATGFSVLPVGSYIGDYNNTYYGLGDYAWFWSANQYNALEAYYCSLSYVDAYVERDYDTKLLGLSVRCVRDYVSGSGVSTTFLPTVTTNTVCGITSTSAICGGNVTFDGGGFVTARGVCWNTSQNPTVSDNHTTDNSGMGSFASNITGLNAATTYYVRAYATNSVGTAYGNEVSFTTIEGGIPQVGIPCPGTPTVTDHEGNVYNTVQIGYQCWTKENLRTTTSPSTGTYLIPASGTDYTYTGKQARWYNDDSTTYAPMNCGLLYNWNAAVDTFNKTYGETSVNYNYAVSVTFNGHRRGICPEGWHLPIDAEWTQLTDYVDSQSEYTCRSSAKALADSTGWVTSDYACTVGNDLSANNATGFSALPAGRNSQGLGEYVVFWSATQYDGYDGVHCRIFQNVLSDVGSHFSDKRYGCSVRCLRDDVSEGGVSMSDLPMVATNTVTNITSTSATCGCNIMSDGGASVTARGVCWSTSQYPTVNDGHTTDGSGMGSFTSSITGLTANTTYYVRAYATNSVGTAYGETLSFTTLSAGSTVVIDEKSCLGTPTVTDHEGNVYATVQIGNQCWMRENLRTTTSPSTGTYLIPDVNTGSTYTGKQARWYNNDSTTYAPMKYGLLYNWNAAVDTFHTAYGETSVNSSNIVIVTFNGYRRGICPAGWHLPSDEEWIQLENYVGGQNEYICGGNSSFIAKALASTEGWFTGTHGDSCVVGNAPSTNNASGFSAVPAGIYDGMPFDGMGLYTLFWSSTQPEIYTIDAWGPVLYYYYAIVDGGTSDKGCGFSVRCLRD